MAGELMRDIFIGDFMRKTEGWQGGPLAKGLADCPGRLEAEGRGAGHKNKSGSEEAGAPKGAGKKTVFDGGRPGSRVLERAGATAGALDGRNFNLAFSKIEN
jgi:hypothetical protein